MTLHKHKFNLNQCYRASLTLLISYLVFLSFVFTASTERICNSNVITSDVFYLRGQSPSGCRKSNGKNSYHAGLSRPVVISGPSGVGKGTLIGKLIERFDEGTFGFSVSHTTRQSRPGEINGEHYHFVSMDEMMDSVVAGQFIEYSSVHGNVYGTSFASVLSVQESGKICILDIDVEGAEKVKESDLDPYLIFIAPPSMDALEQRLRGRMTETEEAIQRRLANARAELDRGLSIKQYFDSVVTNEDLNIAVDELVNIILKIYPNLTDSIIIS